MAFLRAAGSLGRNGGKAALEHARLLATASRQATLADIQNEHGSSEGLAVRAITGCRASRVEGLGPTSEVHRLLGHFSHTLRNVSASVLTDGVRYQTTFSPVFFALNYKVPVHEVADCDMALRGKWAKDYAEQLPLSARLFPETNGREELVKTIKRRGGDLDSSISSSTMGCAESHVNEIKIDYNPSNILGVGLTYARDDLKTAIQAYCPEKFEEIFSKGQNPDSIDDIDDNICTAIYAKAALAAKGHHVPLVIYNNHSFEEVKIPDNVLETAQKHYEKNKDSYESRKIEFKTFFKSFMKMMFFIYLLKDTLELLKDKKKDELSKIESLDDLLPILEALPKDITKQGTEGLAKIAEFLASSDASILDKVMVSCRLALESMFLTTAFKDALSPASFPLRAVQMPLKALGLILAMESAHGHQLHEKLKEGVQSQGETPKTPVA